MAARKVKQSGHSVLVLEARGREGGRMVRREVQAGDKKGWIDLGGQWLGYTQTRIMQLVHELGLETFPQYGEGQTILLYGDRLYLDDSEIPAPTPRDREAVEHLSDALSECAEKIVPDESKPWASPHAPAYDRLTLAQWIDAHSSNDYASFYVSHDAALNHSGGSPREVSLLHTLFEMKANPPDEEPDGFLVTGAAGQIPRLLREKLGDEIFRFRSIAVTIHQDGDCVTVGAVDPDGYQEYRARAVIVAMPPWCAGAIRYSTNVVDLQGALAERTQLMQRMAMGTIAKVTCVYNTPWWREMGLSGTAVVRGRLITGTDDSGSHGDEGPGILTSFIQGNRLFEWISLPEQDRTEWVIDDLNAIFRDNGEKVGHYAEYHEALWPQEQFTGGAYNAYLPPGGWTSSGKALRRPYGRISWAGTETAVKWYGYFDGAATAGERAAEEVKRWLE
jgi:L-amino acid dehydrogenase